MGHPHDVPLRPVLIAAGIFACIAIALLGYEMIAQKLSESAPAAPSDQPGLEARQQVLENMKVQEFSAPSSQDEKLKEAQLQEINATSGSPKAPTHPQTSTQTQSDPQMVAKLHALDSLNNQ